MWVGLTLASCRAFCTMPTMCSCTQVLAFAGLLLLQPAQQGPATLVMCLPDGEELSDVVENPAQAELCTCA